MIATTGNATVSGATQASSYTVNVNGDTYTVEDDIQNLVFQGSAGTDTFDALDIAAPVLNMDVPGRPAMGSSTFGPRPPTSSRPPRRRGARPPCARRWTSPRVAS